MSLTGRADDVPAAAARTTVGRRWAWVATLVVGVGLFELVRGALVDTGKPDNEKAPPVGDGGAFAVVSEGRLGT